MGKLENSIRTAQNCSVCAHYCEIEEGGTGRYIGVCMWFGKKKLCAAPKRLGPMEAHNILTSLSCQRVCDDFYPRRTFIDDVGLLYAFRGVRYRKIINGSQVTFVEEKVKWSEYEGDSSKL